jgi:hypothetical protein
MKTITKTFLSLIILFSLPSFADEINKNRCVFNYKSYASYRSYDAFNQIISHLEKNHPEKKSYLKSLTKSNTNIYQAVFTKDQDLEYYDIEVDINRDCEVIIKKEEHRICKKNVPERKCK